MSSLKDLYRTRLITNNTPTQNSAGKKVHIKFTVDLVTALDNRPSSPDYDEEVHMTSGSAFFIKYRQPDGTFNTVKASFKEQAESFIEQLRNPDSELYQTTEEA